MDAIGARWVLGFGTAFVIWSSWWAILRRLDEDDFRSVDEGGEPFVPVNATRAI